MRISVELVPRNEAALLADAKTVRSVMPQVSAFNIPDLLQFPLRSWEACKVTRSILPSCIPHIRAIDVPPEDPISIGEAIVGAGLTEVLVVRGDLPRDMSHRTYPNSSEDVIRRLKLQHPHIKVYAAFDPYRGGFSDELTAVERKIDAGADGFFTQPLFDLRLLDIWAELLDGRCVFWGIAPVMGERSRAYWETTNRAFFPPSFVPSPDWNRAFAVDAIRSIQSLGGHAYLMPIRVDLAAYLKGLLTL
jgi:methylenetetrahydrofolate reductase (NADPH)